MLEFVSRRPTWPKDECVRRSLRLLYSADGARFYIGINQAVNPVVEGDAITGNNIFAIICVYLFVVFYSFGRWSMPGNTKLLLISTCRMGPYCLYPFK